MSTAPTIGQIQSTVADVFDVDVSVINGKTRWAEYVRPRHIAMYLARMNTRASFPEIGRRFGGRDHTTVMHACNKIADLLDCDQALAAKIAEVQHRLAHPQPANAVR